MRYSQYKFKFYLNASHAIYIKGYMGESHPHTWEIAINILKEEDKFIQFSNLERKIELWMSKYQDSFLNEVDPFTTLNPTLENCCNYFKERLQEILETEGWTLLMIEMSETPTRSYVIHLFDDRAQNMKKKDPEVVAKELLENMLYRLDGKRQ